jgi:hypothetical protein
MHLPFCEQRNSRRGQNRPGHGFRQLRESGLREERDFWWRGIGHDDLDHFVTTKGDCGFHRRIRNRNLRGLGKHKLDRSYPSLFMSLAARQFAGCHSGRRVVIAVHGCGFVKSRIVICWVFRGGVVVRGAHHAVAACHPMCLPGCRPEGRPEQHHGEKADTRPQRFSRSDRNVERFPHGLRLQNSAVWGYFPGRFPSV